MPGQGIEFKVSSADMSALYKAAKAAEGNIQVVLRRQIKAAAKPAVDAVKADASFSSRIPGAVQTKVSFAAKGGSVTVTVDRGKAPNAAPINNKGKSGTFRHPVYGNRKNWVNQNAVPFFVTGTRKGGPAAEKLMQKAMDDIARQLGFTG